jgi:hypothetical protein
VTVRTSLDRLPLFATDAEIGPALLGKRSAGWAGLAALLEREGLPRIDPVMGGRYVPGIKRFFDVKHGVTDLPMPRAADGVEDHGAWKRSHTRRA